MWSYAKLRAMINYSPTRTSTASGSTVLFFLLRGAMLSSEREKQASGQQAKLSRERENISRELSKAFIGLKQMSLLRYFIKEICLIDHDFIGTDYKNILIFIVLQCITDLRYSSSPSSFRRSIFPLSVASQFAEREPKGRQFASLSSLPFIASLSPIWRNKYYFTFLFRKSVGIFL